MNLTKQRRHKSKKIMQFARGQDCLLRLPCCNHNPETTVAAHVSFSGGGMGSKPSDTEIVFACSDCHTYIDNHQETRNDQINLSHEKARGSQQTRQILLDNGLIRI